MIEILVSFLKKTAYAVIGGVLAMVSFAIAGYVPTGSMLELQLFAGLMALLTGAVAAAKRWVERHLAAKQ
jgi:hypothetical protein